MPANSASSSISSMTFNSSSDDSDESSAIGGSGVLIFHHSPGGFQILGSHLRARGGDGGTSGTGGSRSGIGDAGISAGRGFETASSLSSYPPKSEVCTVVGLPLSGFSG